MTKYAEVARKENELSKREDELKKAEKSLDANIEKRAKLNEKIDADSEEKNHDGTVTYTFRLRSAKWSDGILHHIERENTLNGNRDLSGNLLP